MKAISIKQPWANLILSGEKTIETRTWATDYRGELLLVSSLKPDIHPAGMAICVVDLVECRPMVFADEEAARCAMYPNAYSWVLKNLRPIVWFPVRGQLKIYDVPVEGKIIYKKSRIS